VHRGRRMRLVALVLCVSACVPEPPDRNGLDGNLQFDPGTFGVSASGATMPVQVIRYADGAHWCAEGKSGESCEPQDVVPIAIDSATCGDGCTATIDGTIVDVIGTGQQQLAVSVHALDGSDAWTDSFNMTFVPATSLQLGVLTEPIGATFATEVGASFELQAIAFAADGTVLTGTLAPTIATDGAVIATAGADDTLTVSLPSAGTGTLTVSAVGVSKTLRLRAAAPSEWTSISFATFDTLNTEFATNDDAAGLISPLPATVHLELGFANLAAVATLADGSQALLSSSRIHCTPESVVTYSGAGEVGDWAGELEVLIEGTGDATCAVTGFEPLGTLAIHVQ